MSIDVVIIAVHRIVAEGLQKLVAEEPGHNVVGVAGDVAGARGVLKETAATVGLIYVDLADLDTVEKVRKLSADFPETNLIVLSVRSQHGYVNKLFAAGVRGYLLKDSTALELFDAISTVHLGKKYMSEDVMDVVLNAKKANGGTGVAAALTPRELAVLELLLEGKSAKEIAFELNVSQKTILAHRQQLMLKLNVDNLIDLTKLAIRHGLTTA